MRRIVLVAVLGCFMAGSYASAQDRGYHPPQTPPPGDPAHFPKKTDLKIWTDAFNSMADLEEKKSIGLEIAKKFPELAKDGAPHPWAITGNPLSRLDWILDTFGILNPIKFLECFNPHISANPSYLAQCSQRCPFDKDRPDCGYNVPYVFEYWWPETEIEINNFGIAAFNPVEFGRADLLKPALEQFLKAFYEIERARKGDLFPEDLPLQPPNIGQSHWDGLLPTTQVWAGEAHAYRSMVAVNVMARAPRMSLGYVYSPLCFYDSTYPAGGFAGIGNMVVHGWTEQPTLLPIWRNEAASLFLDPELARASMPPINSLFFNPAAVKGYLDQPGAANKYLHADTCASYRLATWPDRYGKGYADLQSALGIVGNTSSALGRICYWGGGQLFPLTGQMMGNYNSLVAAAYLSRRAIQLMSHGAMNILLGPGARIAKYTESVDKLQRIYPRKGKILASGCFLTDDIDEYSNEQDAEFVEGVFDAATGSKGNPRFPKDLVRPEHLGSIRYVYWNKRAACMCPCYASGNFGCSAVDNGDSDSTPPPIGTKGWGPGIPYPFGLGFG